MPRRPFSKVVLCSTHDFGPDRNGQIQRWVESNGGRYSSSMTPEVTHLVATEQAFKQQVDLVRQVRQSKKTKIVTFDWLEDSLLRKSRKPLPTDKYEHDDQKRRSRKKRQNRQPRGGMFIGNSEAKSVNETAAVAGGCAEIAKYGAALDREAQRNELDWKMEGYHIYCDANGFTYAVNLVRQDILAKFSERCMIQVFESDDDRDGDDDDNAAGNKPYAYAAECRYLDRNGEVHSLMVAPRGSSLDLTMDLFRRYFRNRCGVEWGTEGERAGSRGGECFVYQAAAKVEAAGSK
ncbi:hypothetical protein DV736_g1056, partial [Chaetothyriales sp. CBS 134916]